MPELVGLSPSNGRSNCGRAGMKDALSLRPGEEIRTRKSFLPGGGLY
jgi:hypothetical protein